MRESIFVDFDGTIVDVWLRYYSIIKDYFRLTDDYFCRYKLLKYKYAKDEHVLPHLLCVKENEISGYLRFKQEWLENIKYLRLDTLLLDLELLEKFFATTGAYILTARRDEHVLLEQLDYLEIGFLKDRTIRLNPHGINTKHDWFKDNLHLEPFIMIGDSETDLLTGALPNGKAIFVQSGLRNINNISIGMKPQKTYKFISECLIDILNETHLGS